MIEVTILKSSGSYKSLNVNGHAGYSEYGSDIICASISALVINFINSIEKLTNDDFSVETNEDDGRILFNFTDTPGPEATLLMDSLILGVNAILEDNEKYIKLDFKEV